MRWSMDPKNTGVPVPVPVPAAARSHKPAHRPAAHAPVHRPAANAHTSLAIVFILSF